MNLRLFSLAIMLVMVTAAQSQVKISGTIIDADTQTVLQSANIALLRPDSVVVSEILSDTEGSFHFRDVQQGDYLLSVYSAGYESRYIPLRHVEKDINVGDILLTQLEISLNDITVTAGTIIQRPDRKIAIPSANQIATSNNAMTLLRSFHLPHIIVSFINNSISLLGYPVQLRMDGVEVTSAEIIALQPADVVRIEYHDDPGMRYGYAPLVIDFITARVESGGNIAVDLSNAFDVNSGENVVSAKIYHEKSTFSINSHWSRKGFDWTKDNKETFVYPDRVLERVETGMPTKYKMDKVNTALTYNLRESGKYLFNATFRYNYDYVPNSIMDKDRSVVSTSDSDIPVTLSSRNSMKNLNPLLDLYFRRKLGKDQTIIFNIVGAYTDSRASSFYQQSISGQPIGEVDMLMLGDNYSLKAEGIYEKAFGMNKLSAGLKHTQIYTGYEYSGAMAANTGINFAETYTYAEYKFRYSKFNYTFGLGLMRSYNSQEGESNTDYIFRPMLHVAYMINNNTYVRYSGYVSGNPPSLADLSDVTQPIDLMQVQRGNPYLKTKWFNSNTLDVGYNKGIFEADLQVKYTYYHKPAMGQVTFEDEVFVHTNVNYKEFHRLNTSLTLKLKPYKEFITLGVAPGLNRYISKGNDYTHTHSNWRIPIMLTANYKNWIFNAEWNPHWNEYWGETLTQGEKMHQIEAGYNTSRWNLSLALFNPFGKEHSVRNYNESKLASSKLRIYTKDLNPLLLVNFSFNLDFGRRSK